MKGLIGLLKQAGARDIPRCLASIETAIEHGMPAEEAIESHRRHNPALYARPPQQIVVMYDDDRARGATNRIEERRKPSHRRPNGKTR